MFAMKPRKFFDLPRKRVKVAVLRRKAPQIGLLSGVPHAQAVPAAGSEHGVRAASLLRCQAQVSYVRSAEQDVVLAIRQAIHESRRREFT
jgi:hypothetical protein